MAFEATIPSLALFSLSVMFLLGFACEDIRKRQVPNNLMLATGGLGFVAIVVTGHLIDSLLLHLSAFVFVVLFSLLLFRIGAIGGADFKALLVIAITSPGILFANWNNPVFEAVIASSLQIFIMLLLGLVYSRIGEPKDYSEEERTIPLLPFLLIAYFVVQLLALI